jgi:peptidoglycan hydrolase CwlO-like protein
VKYFLGISVLLIAFVYTGTPSFVTAAPTPTPDIDNQIADRQKEIDEVNKKIAELSAKRNATAEEAEAIAIAVEQLKAQLLKAEKELAKTQATITKVNVTKEKTSEDAKALEEDILTKRSELATLVRKLYEYEAEPIMRIFFNSQSLSDVLVIREEYKTLQERTVRVIEDMHAKGKELSEKKENLEQQAEDLTQLQVLLDAQADNIAEKKDTQKKFLAEKKQKQLEFESLIAEAKAAREEINKQIFTLQSGKVNVSLKTAVDMAKFAGKVTGVRPAIIIAVLKVESGVGANLGSGTFPDSMPYSKNREAFLRITAKLGIDPYKTPLSHSGAMGPAQIMPTTWEGMEPRIGQLMGKALVNPYELSDAFVATGIFLADRGAQNPAKEAEALQRYVGGKYWESQSWYSEKVMAVAKEYESQGL